MEGAKNYPLLQEFFKVFLIQTSSSQLRIPKPFTKFFNGITPCTVTLSHYDRNSWEISLEKIEDHLVFKEGWQKFVKEKCLEDGDFLVFQYDSNSTFYVKIFSKNGCRKVDTKIKEEEIESTEKVVPPIVTLDEDLDQNLRKSKRCCKRKDPPNNGLENIRKSKPRGRPRKAAQKTSERDYEENGNNEEMSVPPLKPHFVICFTRWKLSKAEIPRRVLDEMNIKLNTKMNLKDEKGLVWPVEIKFNAKEVRYYFGNGWFDFRKIKNIKEGQQCDFHFVIDKENIAQEVLVHIHPITK